MNEERLFDLIESKGFGELTAEERTLVLEEMSESDYTIQRRIIMEARNVPSNETPAPLILKEKNRIVPLIISSVSSAAAAAILILLFWTPEARLDLGISVDIEFPVTDTLLVENEVKDTVIEYRYVEVSSENEAIIVNECFQVPEYVGDGAVIPVVRDNDLVNNGVSAARDRQTETFRVRPFIGM